MRRRHRRRCRAPAGSRAARTRRPAAGRTTPSTPDSPACTGGWARHGRVPRIHNLGRRTWPIGSTVLADDDPFAPAAEAGIHRLATPTPFAVGRVNTYLIEDDPLTLVDSGPNSGRALDELQGQLKEHGHSIDDIELIVITHQHIDHLGLVEIVASHSGAEV